MTDAWLMDADCIHGIAWYECDECSQPTVEELLAPQEPDGELGFA